MKAKDLQGKNIEDLSEARADALENDSDEPKQDDQVAAAYENISKKLESIRSGKDPEESEESNESKGGEKEEELEEWKGPKPPREKSEESEDLDKEEHELRKVKLHNLEDHESEEASQRQGGETEEDEEEEDEEDQDKGPKESNEPEEPKNEESPKEMKKDWEPKDNDPLDEESEESEDQSVSESDDEPENQKARKPEDEMGDSKGHKEPENLDSEIPVKPDIPDQSENPDTLDDLTTRETSEPEDDYPIPSLKGTGQSSSNMSYNAPGQREGIGESFSKSRYMDSNDPNNFFSQHSQPSQMPKRANKFHLLILIVIGIAVIGFTIYVLKGGFGDINLGSQPSPSPSPTATPTPTPTPTPEPDRSQYKLRVLNGTGKAGLAASVSAKLKELGYQTEKTGNATNSAFTQTVVRVKPSLESFIPQIVKDLAPDYDAAGNASLKDSDAVDIEVILGAK